MLAAKLQQSASGALLQRLKDRIKQDGPLGIAEYMEVCLSDPEYGYYMNQDPFGRAGDFTTAPEISQIFGELIGLWSAVVWRQMGAPGKINLVELGPGRGTLMADALRAIRQVPDFGSVIDPHLVETSPVLRDIQQQSLSSSGVSPLWHDRLDSVPGGPAIVLANEFLDALPVHQFVCCEGVWIERGVGISADGGLEFTPLRGRQTAAVAIPEKIQATAKDGDIAEVRPAAGSLLGALAARARSEKVAALFIDYGHAESTPGETLQAVHKHEYADPLAAPGAADLTAHVDFERFGEEARQNGLEVHGPLTQGAFLCLLGLRERCCALLENAPERDRPSIASGAWRLVDQKEMGTLFKVMALTSPDIVPPPFAPLARKDHGR